MISGMLKVVAALATTAVAIPYTTAILCNLTYGWPQIRHKFRRAFNPKKVFALNFVLIQKLVISLRYAPLYLQWKAYYRRAPATEIMKGRKYGRNDQTLDLYFPRGSQSGSGEGSGPYPVVVFVYGGAWGSGDKAMYGLLCSTLANKLNAIVCCPNHSTYPQGYVDDMIQDIVDCVVWLNQNVDQFNGDRDRLLILGHSSGAHLSVMSLLELLHDELVQASSLQLQPVTASSIQFSEKHFAARSDSDNNDDRQSSASSGSFCVLDGKNSNGSQSDGQQSNSGLAASQFEVLATQKSETEMSDASLLEGDLQALGQMDSSGLRYRGTGSSTEEDKEVKEILEGGSGTQAPTGGEEEEDSGDNDSVITVRPKEGDLQLPSDVPPSLLQLGKSVKAIIGLAGVYHIGDHFLHESQRGVEDVSTMARSMYGQEHFDRFSPTHILQGLKGPLSFPKMVLLHGTEDYVVPITSTTKLGNELKRLNCDTTVRIIPGCDHYEICMDLMQPTRKFHKPVMALIEETAASVFL